MKKSLLAVSLLCTFLMVGCAQSTSNESKKDSTVTSAEQIDSSDTSESSVAPESSSQDDPTPATKSEFSVTLEHTAKFSFGYANSIYQGSSDTFARELPEALANGTYKVAEDADGSEVASFTGGWNSLTLNNNGNYTLSDTYGIGMSETGTWSLNSYVLKLQSSVEGAEAKSVRFGNHYSIAFVNSLYQGAGDTFDFGTLPEALASGSFTVAEGADGSEVASFTGSWMKLSLDNKGGYTLSDNAGYGMSETGTWSLNSFAFAFKSSVEGAKEVKFALKDILTVAFANPLYQGAGDSFAVELPDTLAGGSFAVAEGADGSEVASFTGSWMKLSLNNKGGYTLSDNVGYGMSETGTWSLNSFVLDLVSGYQAA